MSASRRLIRGIDLDLVERIHSGGKPVARSLHKRKRTPRDASSYRGARRNADRTKGWPDATFAKSRPQLDPIWIPLNRSRHLPFADSYARARIISERKRNVGALP